jgi:hypothetical protein
LKWFDVNANQVSEKVQSSTKASEPWESGVQNVVKLFSKNREVPIREKVNLGRSIMESRGSLIQHRRILEDRESRVQGSFPRIRFKERWPVSFFL